MSGTSVMPGIFLTEKKEKYLIDQTFSRDILTRLIDEELNHQGEVIIIGFSQGGYLAPFVRSTLKQVTKVIMINANLKVEISFQKY